LLCGPYILVIENDDATIQLILRQLMETFGEAIRLECTSALAIACESLSDTKFDAIFLDLSVANNSNCTVVPMLYSLAPNTPIFLLLDKGYQVQEVELSRLGPGGYLFKRELGKPDWANRLGAAMLNRGGFQHLGEVKHYTVSAN
jgi:DNA-binding NarL/FixJ family response regulator